MTYAKLFNLQGCQMVVAIREAPSGDCHLDIVDLSQRMILRHLRTKHRIVKADKVLGEPNTLVLCTAVDHQHSSGLASIEHFVVDWQTSSIVSVQIPFSYHRILIQRGGVYSLIAAVPFNAPDVQGLSRYSCAYIPDIRFEQAIPLCEVFPLGAFYAVDDSALLVLCEVPSQPSVRREELARGITGEGVHLGVAGSSFIHKSLAEVTVESRKLRILVRDIEGPVFFNSSRTKIAYMASSSTAREYSLKKGAETAQWRLDRSRLWGYLDDETLITLEGEFDPRTWADGTARCWKISRLESSKAPQTQTIAEIDHWPEIIATGDGELIQLEQDDIRFIVREPGVLALPR